MHATTVSITGWFLAEIIIIEHLIAAFIGMTLWKSKRGDPSGAFVLCAILGILGVLLLAVATPRRKEIAKGARSQGRVPCPHCAELIMLEALICRYCQHDVAAPVPAGTL
jgi:hypothetical protein